MNYSARTEAAIADFNRKLETRRLEGTQPLPPTWHDLLCCAERTIAATVEADPAKRFAIVEAMLALLEMCQKTHGGIR